MTCRYQNFHLNTNHDKIYFVKTIFLIQKVKEISKYRNQVYICTQKHPNLHAINKNKKSKKIVKQTVKKSTA